LTGLLLPSFKIISIPSQANYWAQVRQMYPETKTPSAPISKAIEWSADDERRLLYLIDETIQKANRILLELLSEPEFAKLPARKQAKLFSTKVGTDACAALLHLARLNQLNSTSAHRVLKSPEMISVVLGKLDE